MDDEQKHWDELTELEKAERRARLIRFPVG